MSADSSVRTRARSCVAALLVSLVSVPVGAALQPAPAHAASFGQLVLDEAARHYGKPYSWGATGPGSFDCSGFVGYVFRQFGVELPRTSRDQYNAVQHVPQDQKQPGDLIFTYDGGGIYHVAIYAGGNQAWAATKSGDIVRPQNLWTSSYLVGRVHGAGPAVGGAIGAHWEALGAERSVVGGPLNGEHSVPGAQKVDFERGDVYWAPHTGAREVHGAIVGLYDRMGGTTSALGLPVTDEHDVPGARANRFVGGAIYWSPWTGEREVHGAIAAKYDALGGPASPLGLPTSDELSTPGGRVSVFAQGIIVWGPATGAREVRGAILQRYRDLHGSAGPLGLPVTDERATPGGRESVFQGGTLRWNAATNTVTLVR